MIPVVYKRLRSGKRKPIAFTGPPREWKEFVTYEHGVERWYA